MSTQWLFAEGGDSTSVYPHSGCLCYEEMEGETPDQFPLSLCFFDPSPIPPNHFFKFIGCLSLGCLEKLIQKIYSVYQLTNDCCYFIICEMSNLRVPENPWKCIKPTDGLLQLIFFQTDLYTKWFYFCQE